MTLSAQDIVPSAVKSWNAKKQKKERLIMDINKIEWANKTVHNPKMSKGDVKISLYSKKNKGYLINFAFYNSTEEVLRNVAKITVSKIVENRIYFLFDQEDGYKLHAPHGKNSTKSIIRSISQDEARQYINKWEHFFKLEKDEECNLYYIENRKGNI